MTKLSEYVEMAANEYLQETGNDELDACWIAEFFQDGGVQDGYPRQDLVAFSDQVQKALSKKSERAGKQTRFQLDKIVRFVRQLRKP
jgi:energy-converting hydrogenase A subunit M